MTSLVAQWGKNLSAGDPGMIPGLGRSPGGGNSKLLQYSCLENPIGQSSLADCSPWGVKFYQSVQSVSRVQLFATPWTAACQASLSVTNSRSLLKLMPIVSVMSSNHLILCHPPFLLPLIFPSIRVISNESVLRIRGPKYWSFSFNISLPMNIQDWFPLGLIGRISLQSKGL